MAIKSFNRTVEAINVLLDKLDGLPTYPMCYQGEVLEYTDLPEEPAQGDCYLVSFETNTDHVANKLYYYNGTTWKEIAVDGYTKYEIDTMFAAIGNGLHWLGAVSYYNNLPNNAELGDMWTVLYEGTSGTDPCGDEYAWGTLSGTEQWILVGKETYTKAQIDTKLAAKQNTTFTSYTVPTAEETITSNTTVQDAVEQLDYRTQTIKTNISSILAREIRKVYVSQNTSSTAHTYKMTFDDFQSPNATVGTYLITIVTWSVTPSFKLYAVSFSGANLDYTTISQIYGEHTITVDSEHNITLTASGKVTIYALR